ncbi:hypothetical protein [Nocardia sp. NBC_01388]|uniref:hypothetical protein n=1 Tax=Nocardia sp. NBC_01388 TaxID=2903596 RepID=UPI00324FB497
MLSFTGCDVLPPFVAHSAVHLNDQRYTEIADSYRQHLATAFTAEPIPYRSESGGDYTGLTYQDGSELVPGREPHGTSGFALHIAAPS